MEELTNADIDDWLGAHNMVILGGTKEHYRPLLPWHEMGAVWIYHRDTRRGNWVNVEFVRRLANADATPWPISSWYAFA